MSAKNLIKEAINGEQKMFVQGVLQRAGAKNANGRIYPRDILEREAKKYAEVYIKEKRAFGELDHPDSSIVSVKNACHTVEDLWWKGNDLYGKLEILTGTPSGNIVAAIINAGKTLGISSRGLGSVKTLTEDTVEVQEDFELIAWDFVSSPSTHGAFMNKINENVDLKIKKYYYINRIVNDIIKTGSQI